MSRLILDDHDNVVEVPDEEAWEWQRANPERMNVAKGRVGDLLISTAFLGVDYSLSGGAMQAFETLVVRLDGDEWVRIEWATRYGWMRAAKEGHAEHVKRAQAGEWDEEK